MVHSSGSLQTLFSLSGRTTLVTGGAGWLGRAIAETHAEQGANVVVAARSQDKCNDLCRELSERYEDQIFLPLAMDVRSEDSIRMGREEIARRIGRVDVLVNNAWSGKTNSWESIDYSDWSSDIEVGLNSVFRMIKAFEDDLMAQSGVVVNIASMYGHLSPNPSLYEGNSYVNPPSYGAAKAGLIQLTRYLASFWGEKGVRVNAISPGPFPQLAVQEDEEFIDRLAMRNPLKRIGAPEDLKGMVALLSSDASAYITGQNFCVDGGWGIW